MTVTGIGGVFFRARDPKALATWYREHLGIGIGPYGQWEQAAGPTVFSLFDMESGHIPAGKTFMLNLRVDDLAATVGGLQARGVAVATDPAWNSEEAGRFARVEDPEGNAIELWEPPAE